MYLIQNTSSGFNWASRNRVHEITQQLRTVAGGGAGGGGGGVLEPLRIFGS